MLCEMLSDSFVVAVLIVGFVGLCVLVFREGIRDGERAAFERLEADVAEIESSNM